MPKDKIKEEVEYEFESENEPESEVDEVEQEVEPQAQEEKPQPRKRYASTKGDADKRRAQCLINLAKARQAKVEKAQAKKLADSQVHHYKIENSESDESEEDEPAPKLKRKSSKPMNIPQPKQKKTSAKEESRLDRIEAFMEQIAQAKAKPKAKVVRNTIVQVPAYGQPSQDPRIGQLTRKLFHDI